MLTEILEPPTEEQIAAHRQALYMCSHPNSWVWDEALIAWVAPKAPPEDGYPYIWSEEQLNWVPFPDYPRT
jgi:hypothetical protein